MVSAHIDRTETRKYDFFIQWHLTEKCNLSCSHCYQSKAVRDEMTFDEIKDVISEAGDMFRQWQDEYNIEVSPGFNITGGEPFLHRDIFRILEEIKSSGFEIYILSNGTLIDDKTSDILSEIGVNGVQISIEGAESVHDSIRGRGSFQRALSGTKYLLARGTEVSFNTTLSKLNYLQVHDIVSLALNAGVKKAGFSRLVPTGRGKQFIKEMIETDKVRAVYDNLLGADIDGLDIVTGDPVASQRNVKLSGDTGETALGGCAAGVSGLTFMPDGTITPCRRMNIPVGNLRNDCLREVWAESEVLSRLRDKSHYNGWCGQCSRWAGCRGCWAIAYAYSQSKGENDFLAEDPQCFIDEIQTVNS